MDPSVSVIMSVHNGEHYLREAVDSILTQTYTDFEFIIIDDASTDATPGILADYAARDSRVILQQNEANLGLTKSLNIGLRLARGRYLARQDADDISLPHRFERQVRYLDEHLETNLLGAQCFLIDAQGAPIGDQSHFPTTDAAIRWYLLADNAIAHPTAMFRRALIETTGLCYDITLPYAQDYDLWVRMAEYGPVANLDEPLIRYRFHEGSVSAQRRQEQRAIARRIADRQLVSLLPELASKPAETDALRNLVFGYPPYRPEAFPLLDKLLEAFRTRHGLSAGQFRTLKRYSLLRMLDGLRSTKHWWISPVLWRLARLDRGYVTQYVLSSAMKKGVRVYADAVADRGHRG